MENKKGKMSIIEKFKKSKNFEIIIIVAFVAVLLLIYFSTSKTKTQTNIIGGEVPSVINTTENYANHLEDKLCNVLKNIKNAGNVSCMLKLSGSIEYVYARDSEEVVTESTISGTTTTKTTSTDEIVYIKIDGEDSPILLEEIYPTVKSVVVIASGANDISVMLNIKKATSILLEIDQNLVEVLVGE